MTLEEEEEPFCAPMWKITWTARVQLHLNTRMLQSLFEGKRNLFDDCCNSSQANSPSAFHNTGTSTSGSTVIRRLPKNWAWAPAPQCAVSLPQNPNCEQPQHATPAPHLLPPPWFSNPMEAHTFSATTKNNLIKTYFEKTICLTFQLGSGDFRSGSSLAVPYTFWGNPVSETQM